eukprot:jgi/Botrbrau1/8234/Bobra.0392s0029.2
MDLNEQEFGRYEIYTCRPELEVSLCKHLFSDDAATAWLAACQDVYNVTSLVDLRTLNPNPLPSWIADELLDILELRGPNVVLNPDRTPDTDAQAAIREAQLQRFLVCPLKDGYASEGLLCNSPPIPLRVLDFLDASDILNLSLVCKDTHHGSHHLFRREEAVLRKADTQVVQLQNDRTAERHRCMRIASLMCGAPEKVNISDRCPGLLRGFAAQPDSCTQPRARFTAQDGDLETNIVVDMLRQHRASLPTAPPNPNLYLVNRDLPTWKLCSDLLGADVSAVFKAAYQHDQPVFFRVNDWV